MAEAHQAVSYSELIKHEHTDTNHRIDEQSSEWCLSSALGKPLGRNGADDGLSFFIEKVPYDLVNVVMMFAPESTLGWQIFACCAAAIVFWFAVCMMMRYTLKMLLMYKGFMFESRGKKVSKTTIIWGILVKFFVNWNTPTLYSFQGSLPRLPLPKVKDTMTRYLRSMRPLLDDAEYERTVKLAEEFQNGIGKRLQRYLWLKSWWSSNYVSDWWEEYVYLRGRSPLMVNSNYYGTDSFALPTNSQTARAANMTYWILQFRKKIERQELRPIMAQGLVPLCSAQYERMFNTVRVPGIETDTIVHYDDIKHITVLHKGCYYKMMIYHDGRLLNPKELQFQLDQIISGHSNSSHAETYLASLTGWHRTKWAQARHKYFSSGVNKASLETVESSAFFLILDDRPFEYDVTNTHSEKFDYYAVQALHGKIYDRWFDKSFSLCMGTNARFVMNAEHTWADAPVCGHMFEDSCLDDMLSYDEKGNLLGSMECKPPLPVRLNWEFSDQLVNTIDEAYNDGLKLINDVDHKLVLHDSFGKGFIKTCRLSPDAYIQMALQLAYFRDYGKFSQTYEASMTRLFRDGRTETVRPCTIESAAWVRSMEDKNSNTEERVKLLNEACNRHQQGYLDAMCGRGIDRHLFCLYVVSKYLEVESPFLQQAINEPWRLSTSQTPHGQTARIDLKKYPGLTTPGGGFGPVSFDGYSVSYIISGEDKIFFHLSSTRSCEKTNTERFAKNVFKAMSDIKIIFDDYNKTQKINAKKNGTD